CTRRSALRPGRSRTCADRCAAPCRSNRGWLPGTGVRPRWRAGRDQGLGEAMARIRLSGNGCGGGEPPPREPAAAPAPRRPTQALPPRLHVTGAAYTKVGNALNTFADALTGLQQRMSPLRVKAPSLWEAMQEASRRLSAAQSADQQHAAKLANDMLTRSPVQP